jgi:hypothetical protein
MENRVIKFTGKTDEKGREIFEGDIYYKTIDSDKEYYVCAWINERSCYAWVSLPLEYEEFKAGKLPLKTEFETSEMHYFGNIENTNLIR